MSTSPIGGGEQVVLTSPNVASLHNDATMRTSSGTAPVLGRCSPASRERPVPSDGGGGRVKAEALVLLQVGHKPVQGGVEVRLAE
jgi:hypothetical protein